MSRIFIAGLVLCGIFSGIVGCTKKDKSGAEEKVVHLSIWGNYLSPEMQTKFENKTGIKISISNYSSNEELLAKIQVGSSGVDVAVPSDYMVDIMTKMNLLEPLQQDKIPNHVQISEQFLKQSYDPENKFSYPYSWSTTGIAYNKVLFKGTIKSWRDLLTNPQLKGKLALLDDVREALGAALKMNGFSVNSTNPAELAKAKETLLEAKKNVKMFTSDTIDILKNNEVVAAQTYSSDALQAAAKSQGKIEYVLPEEGGVLAIDNLVIIKGAKHIEAAHKLINFLLSQETEVNKVNSIKGGPVLKGTRAVLLPELQSNRVLFPEPMTLQKLEHIHDLGEANKLYEEIWTEVKTK